MDHPRLLLSLAAGLLKISDKNDKNPRLAKKKLLRVNEA
jgi:hypothetical protein